MGLPMDRLLGCCYRLLSFVLTGVIACSSVGASKSDTNPIEQEFLAAGLVDIQSIDPTVRVKLVNSDSDDNFFGEDFYHGLQKAYLQKSVALKLSRAQKTLKRKHQSYSLLIMDAARPHSVSAAMYEEMKGTRFEKYVANPKKGSMHNYGAAVDLTIVDQDGDPLDMGFNPFYKSKIGIALSYLFSGDDNLSEKQLKNRRLLKSVMLSAGFVPLAHEWWHFSGFSKDEIKKRFEIIR